MDQLKANGLHSGTKFYERSQDGYQIEHHEHPATHELIVVKTWFVPDGEDDVMPQFEVIDVQSPTICEMSKTLALIEEKIKTL